VDAGGLLAQQLALRILPHLAVLDRLIQPGLLLGRQERGQVGAALALALGDLRQALARPHRLRQVGRRHAQERRDVAEWARPARPPAGAAAGWRPEPRAVPEEAEPAGLVDPPGDLVGLRLGWLAVLDALRDLVV